MHEFEYNRKLLNRLRLLQGQLGGIERMIRSNRCPYDVSVQFSAADHALHKLVHDVFFESMQKHAAFLLSMLYDKYSACPRILETLDTIKKDFRTYTIFKLPSIITLLCELDHIDDKKQPE